MASFLPHLTLLSLGGCKAITVRGWLPLIQAARGGLLELALESVHLVSHCVEHMTLSFADVL